jgi:uncharacterized membrane protein YedE/YeeE
MRIDPPEKLLLGLATGVAFGALLQKGRASDYEVIQGQLALRDPTVAQLMGTAIAVGAPPVQALFRRGVARPQIKPLNLGVGLGAALFGAGMAILGYCPGTTVAAAGEGRRDALSGLLGMLAGAAAFVRLAPRLRPLLERRSLGKATLPGLTRTPAARWLAGTALGALALDALPARARS